MTIARKMLCVTILVALTLPHVANNQYEPCTEELINNEVVNIEVGLSRKDRLEQLVSRGEIRSLTMEITAYTDDEECQEEWKGETATGIKPQIGVVAVDPKVIPLGTKMYIDGYGDAIAGDTGGAIQGNKIDVFMDTNKECLNFGIQNRKVFILER